MNRRDFLDPTRLSAAAGQLLGLIDELPSPPPAENPPPEIALLRVSRRAMATTFEVLLPFGTPDGLAVAEAALDEIDRLETQLTVYHDSSDVSRINRNAATAPVAVEERLFALLETAARITEETHGAFDVSAGALVRAWGFLKGPRRVPSDTERQRALDRVGMRHVVLDPERRTVHFLQPGLEINLGSIGKGYALDRAAILLRRDCGVTCGLLHGGHSSILGIGHPPGDGQGWPVGVRHPWNEQRLAVLRLRDRALATSAATFRHLEYNGRKLGHHLDPRTGWPAEGMASATVVAPTAAEADALSTAFFVLGVEAARTYCETHLEIGALLLESGEGASPVMVGLAPGEVELLV